MAIRYYDTKHGRIAMEVDEAFAGAVADEPATSDEYVAKGYEATSKGADKPTTFQEALESLKAYSSNIGELVDNLDVRPREVAVEVGLKFAGEAGFIIAKAGTEVEMKVSLTWTPKPLTS